MKWSWNGLFEIELVLLEIRKKYVGSVFLNNALFLKNDQMYQNYVPTFIYW